MNVAAHQCNFFPASSIINKCRRADLFVILSQAQFCRRQYHSRFHVGERWYTMAVNAGREPLIAKRYVEPERDWTRIKRGLPKYAGILAHFDSLIGEGLVATNHAILCKILALLGVDTPIVFDYPTELTGTERLIDLCRHYGATTYLSGPSGPKYMDMEAFREAGIGVEVMPASEPRAAVEVLAEGGVT